MRTDTNSQGFTLIELMLVIALMGIVVSFVQFAFRDDQLEQELHQQAEQFIAVFEAASEYGMLNNIELGLVVSEQHYQFVGYDGTQWTELADNDALTSFTMPDQVSLELSLEDLPIDEKALFDINTFINQDELDQQDTERNLVPQVVILSGGDISSFKLNFVPTDEFIEPLIYFSVEGQYHLPLSLTGPIRDE